MINVIIKIISKIYNEKIESACTRLLYFFNTINSYYLFAGIMSFLLVCGFKVNIFFVLISMLIVFSTSIIADFYPVFLFIMIPVIIAQALIYQMPLLLLINLLITNICIFLVVQYSLMGLPDSIIARDIKVSFIKIYNSIFTIAPTTVSLLMSVSFSFYVSFNMLLSNYINTETGYSGYWVLNIILILGAFIVRSILPKNHFSRFHKPDVPENPLFERVIIFNIDGARKDVFDSLNLKSVGILKKEGSSHKTGLETVYRALTNPAFASIYTGTIPSVHGIKDNNFGQAIKTEGLPDIVPTISYGSMHVKHFCKSKWETKIVSLPRHSIYGSDSVMVDWLKEDILKRKEVRLFIADFSEADFLAHAYGSTSKSYKEALTRIDDKIGEFIKWYKDIAGSEKTAFIICSDHGISEIDHSYLIAKSERYVPFVVYGKGIKKGYIIETPGKIMDICCTVAYLLGIRYPEQSRGQVYTEILEKNDNAVEKELLSERFNVLKYNSEAKEYESRHAEIYAGDSEWWDAIISKYASNGASVKILDIGCGNGFIADRFLQSGIKIEKFVGQDISAEMIKEAEKKYKQYRNFTFTENLKDSKEEFDIITVSSVFHHVVFPEKLAQEIDSLLKKGGLVISSHEPNKNAFKNVLFYLAANIYKAIGGGVSIDDATVLKFNQLLHVKYPKAPGVCREEILQLVEYHSPLEQYDIGINKDVGFNPEEFFNKNFKNYELLSMETYTTFFCRPWLIKHNNIKNILIFFYKLIFKEGNLFKFVIKKS